MDFDILPFLPQHHDWARQVLSDAFGSDLIVVHQQKLYPLDLPGFVARAGDQWVGLAIYTIERKQCELVSLGSLAPNQGIGAALTSAVKQIAIQQGCWRLWLITTNDNLNALRFYQKHGFTLAALYPKAVTQARLIKPSIPLMGETGIEIRDEIELEMLLEPE
jgi:GNAT superfamily N-acetyltransferase